MADLHLKCFVNDERPHIDNPAVKEIPLVLGEVLCAQLETSLKVDVNNLPACAASARLWESLLETHRLPYLLLRVADVHHTLNSYFTALKLYQELQSLIQDAQFGSWLAKKGPVVMAELQKNNEDYKGCLGRFKFTPSQRWKSTITADKDFPYCRMSRAQLASIQTKWKELGPPEDVMARFLNLHCLETNDIEGIVQLHPTACTRLTQVGFYHQLEQIPDLEFIGGVVRNRADAMSILRDAHQTFNAVFEILRSDPGFALTVDTLCRLHKTLMKTSRILSEQTRNGLRSFRHINIGVTRQTTRFNVTAGTDMTIQFCPNDSVDAELEVFCQRFNELLKIDDMDPFAATAWISHVFLTIHPFEDGNGRISRIIASIPLVKKGYPPISIGATHKKAYIDNLNFVRANRDGDYSSLMQAMHLGTSFALSHLKEISDSEHREP